MLEKYAIDGYKDVFLSNNIGIFGCPIGHTLSPVIHDNLSDYLGLKEKYIPFLIEDDLEDRIKDAYNDGILGLNITVPHKENVMKALVDIDEDAKHIGAVNTLVRVDGGYKGYNTDMPGLARAIFSDGITLDGAKVIILGAGGAARAVAYMCGKYNASKVYIINRTVEKAKQLCGEMNEIFGSGAFEAVSSDCYKDIPKDKYIFLQSTSVGLHAGDGLPLIKNEKFYMMAKAGVDLIYNPAETEFIKLLKKQGVKAINGLKMLLYQGVMAYELWNDVKVTDEMSDCIYRKLCNRLYGNSKDDIKVLVGYMGSGKSTIGKKLAEKLECPFVDTDEYIVEKERMTINEIFETKGEEYFRNLETKVIGEIADKYPKCILSTGGGMPVREENRRALKNIGKVYYLRTNADIIYDRVKNSSDRPLLQGDNLYDKICNMLNTREPLYFMASDYVIDVNDSISNIVEKIISV